MVSSLLLYSSYLFLRDVLAIRREPLRFRLPQFSNSKARKNAQKLFEVSKQVQEANPPLIIPRFAHLRRLCLEQTQLDLGEVEKELRQMDTSSVRTRKVADAVKLLEQLGK